MINPWECGSPGVEAGPCRWTYAAAWPVILSARRPAGLDEKARGSIMLPRAPPLTTAGAEMDEPSSTWRWPERTARRIGAGADFPRPVGEDFVFREKS